jgi:hypothetical protein
MLLLLLRRLFESPEAAQAREQRRHERREARQQRKQQRRQTKRRGACYTTEQPAVEQPQWQNHPPQLQQPGYVDVAALPIATPVMSAALPVATPVMSAAQPVATPGMPAAKSVCL